MNDQLGRHFDLTLHSLCPGREIPIYADFVNPWNVYEVCIFAASLVAIEIF